MTERKRFVLLLVLLLIAVGLVLYVQYGIENNFVESLR